MHAIALRQCVGPGLALVVWLAVQGAGLPGDMAAVLAAAAWILAWWVLEAAPLGVTSVMPLVLFPLFGVTDVAEAAVPYGSKYVFLFMGGFLIALALERWQLHRRFALNILVLAGGQPRRLLAGFMLATAGLSMWISNTATTLMMLPIAMSVLNKIRVDRHPRFPVALLLGTAYAANLGGIATLVGTPPNVAMAGLLETHVGQSVPFLEWMVMAVPFSALMLAVVYVLLTRVLCRISSDAMDTGVDELRQELQSIGPWSVAEQRVAWVFGGTACLWVGRRLLVEHLGMPLNDTSIAMAAGVALFLIRSQEETQRTLLTWAQAQRLPWDILLLFGGGLTLAAQLAKVGVLDMVAENLASIPSLSTGLLVAGFVMMSLLFVLVRSYLDMM